MEPELSPPASHLWNCERVGDTVINGTTSPPDRRREPFLSPSQPALGGGCAQEADGTRSRVENVAATAETTRRAWREQDYEELLSWLANGTKDSSPRRSRILCTCLDCADRWGLARMLNVRSYLW